MKSSVYRLFVERKDGFDIEADRLFSELTCFVGVKGLAGVRFFSRYDIEGIDYQTFMNSIGTVFSEPQSDRVFEDVLPVRPEETVLSVEYLPGQYDQRADSAEQCLALLGSGKEKPIRVRCARVYVFSGNLDPENLEKIRIFLINPVDSREASPEKPATLEMRQNEPPDVPVMDGFTGLDNEGIAAFIGEYGLAMDRADALFLQSYFKSKGRNPTEAEIRVLDTYWSDHCRHTTFNTNLESVSVEEGPYKDIFLEALSFYSGIRAEVYGENADIKPVTLMDMAVIGAKALKKRGFLNDLEESGEINACSIFIDVNITDEKGIRTGTETWLLMFKNETHNHPTEIEPFGGAATCIGGAIRDPLSGRSWVYQALRVTGAGNPTVPIEATVKGKLPQIQLTREAAAGFSSYGNQIGLTTGQVVEYYDPGFLAKRMELGAVIAAAPASSVIREEPETGDVVILLGGGTGRDGIGGATGSSKAHTVESVATAGAEVQKGNAPEERKIQRLFRDPDTAKLIRRCNDFGAGGVAVAVGELAAGIDINLDAVPKKYAGLTGTEIAISESQERMAVVVRQKDTQKFIEAAKRENLNAAVIAVITDKAKLVMNWKGRTIVDIDRSFLDTAGAQRSAKAIISQPSGEFSFAGKADSSPDPTAYSLADRWISVLSDISVASRRGLSERFDGSIGSASVLFPMGGFCQSTPEAGMAARIPVPGDKHTTTVSLMTMGYDPKAANWSPFHAAQYAVLESLAKILALGGDPRKARLSFQEYFERTENEKAWGKPAAALLGALKAQIAAGTPSIGGKDSMSGTFHDMHVPPTLVSFAVSVTEDAKVRSGALASAGSLLVLIQTPWLEDQTPDWDAFLSHTEKLLALSGGSAGESSAVRAAYPVGAGGIAACLSKMAFGNSIGMELDAEALSGISIPHVFDSGSEKAAGDKNSRIFEADNNILFAPLYGSLIIELADTETVRNFIRDSGWVCIGKTNNEQSIQAGPVVISLDEACKAWEHTLARVFPPVSGASGQNPVPDWAHELYQTVPDADKKIPYLKENKKPLVVLPVFPGTNCEFDMARAFRLAGADIRTVVLRNRTEKDLEESIFELQTAIDQAHILAFSGGFSAGDEPDGSGKFIAAIIRENRIADSIMNLTENRKNLILGICNGFQALIKTGLVPYGKILDPSEDMPTLTHNTIGRHISRFVSTRIVSRLSPWSDNPDLFPGKIHKIPISHGEGRVIIREALAKELFAAGQIFTQYVDKAGLPASLEPDNPNGSMYAIEGMTDSSGRILGKMGHSERPIDFIGGKNPALLFKNIPGDTIQNIFTAGVRYFY
ncbi:phosphoribosylformylglycinamidine synthase [Brucepastera parasyntrophica]|uniref:phosphoribosylformylglycinamidine synthase n=1 Tax=Brucepastera parasyntrophica TaxID=2880008 RepID=UPI00210CE61F|nr:phosphoribosylformylglycinamidine synthase [Brucepastera parasyntrophica]ULQ59835.1 phosphoribosylformylglycinamidine synthase [Brucepastera parasyntrophica]